MPKSLTHKISLSFILIVFAEGHIMNSPFCRYCSIVRSSGAVYGHVKPVSVC